MVDDPGNNGDQMPEWDDLQDVWQDTPSIDMAKMVRNARFVWWRMRINFALELVLSIVGLLLFGSFVDFASLPATTLGLLGMFYCAMTMWAAFHIRRGAWDDPGKSALSLVQLQIRRAKSAILYFRLNSWFGYAGLLLIPVGYWVMYERFGSLDHQDMNTVHWVFGGLAVFILGFPLVTLPLVRKKKEELEALEAIEHQLLGEE